MRADNHQLVQPLFISSFVKAGGKGVKYDVERTGMGFKTEGRVEANTLRAYTLRAWHVGVPF
jgi:branched-chain amino acid transport system substrate-binding protein